MPSGAPFVPAYVSVTGTGVPEHTVLKVKVIPTGVGRCVFVSPVTLDGVAPGTPLTCVPRTIGDLRREALWHEPRLSIARWALAAAVGGMVIDATLAIGGAAKYLPVPWVIRVDAFVIAMTIAFSTVLKLGGGLLLFWKGFLEWDPK